MLRGACRMYLMKKIVRPAPGVEIVICDNQIVQVATCGRADRAEQEVCAYADAEDGLGYEQAIAFGPWTETVPSGWRRADVLAA